MNRMAAKSAAKIDVLRRQDLFPPAGLDKMSELGEDVKTWTFFGKRSVIAGRRVMVCNPSPAHAGCALFGRFLQNFMGRFSFRGGIIDSS